MAILIIDDSGAFQNLVEKLLAKHGIAGFVFASSAAEAFSILGLDSKGGGREKLKGQVDLIMLDKTLPDMDGIDVCRIFKDTPSLADTPILMATASGDMATLEKAFDAGAHDYIAKPMSELELLARVRAALALKREIDKRNAFSENLLKLSGELSAVNERLTALSMLDGLTGIPNRRSLDEYMAKMTALAARNMRPLSVIMIDIDFFKPYNDKNGHLAGDDCLRSVASAIHGCIKRRSDMAARYGGEEFVVVLPETDADGAAVEAEGIRKAVESLGIPHGASNAAPVVTISIGVASRTPKPGDSPDIIVHAADSAMYAAKARGRNRVEISR